MCFSKNFGQLQFIDSIGFMPMSLEEIVKTFQNRDFVIFKKLFGDHCCFTEKKIACLNEAFKNSIDFWEIFSDLHEKD